MATATKNPAEVVCGRPVIAFSNSTVRAFQSRHPSACLRWSACGGRYRSAGPCSIIPDLSGNILPELIRERQRLDRPAGADGMAGDACRNTAFDVTGCHEVASANDRSDGQSRPTASRNASRSKIGARSKMQATCSILALCVAQRSRALRDILRSHLSAFCLLSGNNQRAHLRQSSRSATI
jgi:hypothetical protein